MLGQHIRFGIYRIFEQWRLMHMHRSLCRSYTESMNVDDGWEQIFIRWIRPPGRLLILLGICTGQIIQFCIKYYLTKSAQFRWQKQKAAGQTHEWTDIHTNVRIGYTYYKPRRLKAYLCCVQTTKTQTSLCIRAVWSAPLLFAISKVQKCIISTF